MQRRQWDATTKALIVLEGLTGKPVAEICPEHEINQALYDPWRDQFLAHAAQAFESPQPGQREARLGREDARWKQLVGELLLELKTSDALLG